MSVPAAEEHNITARYLCSNVTYSGGDSVIRVVYDTKPRENAVQVVPNMEDMYLYHFGKQN